MANKKKPSKPHLRVGQLCYLKNVGYPFNREGKGHDNLEGASVTVVKLNAGGSGKLVEVRTLLPNGTEGRMRRALFWPEQVIPEDRPWLRKRILTVLRLQSKLRDFKEEVEALL